MRFCPYPFSFWARASRSSLIFFLAAPRSGFAQRIFFNSDSLCRIYLFGILEVDGVGFPSHMCQVDGGVKGGPAIPCPGDGGFGEV